MITEAIIKVLGGVLSFIVGLIPNVDAPSWLTGATEFLADGLSAAGAFAWFMPVTAIGQCFVFLIAVQLVVWAVRVLRIAASFVTGGGGSAA